MPALRLEREIWILSSPCTLPFSNSCWSEVGPDSLASLVTLELPWCQQHQGVIAGLVEEATDQTDQFAKLVQPPPHPPLALLLLPQQSVHLVCLPSLLLHELPGSPIHRLDKPPLCGSGTVVRLAAIKFQFSEPSLCLSRRWP